MATMDNKNIAAWTEKTPNIGSPQFISINRTGDYDLMVEISVRERGPDGLYAKIIISREELALLLLQTMRNLQP